ncbi:unnamed protein product [Spirodela intermedia]|uniref:Uncharacterized protein n=1 Tax=Spirodela intermedia TaxID=51605 RepID=A0A7I8K6I2_SPIIN|nr:unnamed protein product [Spirodela intermedia]
MKGSSRWTNKRRARAKRRKTVKNCFVFRFSTIFGFRKKDAAQTISGRWVLPDALVGEAVRAFHAAPENGVGVSSACTVTPVEHAVHRPVQPGPSYVFSWLASDDMGKKTSITATAAAVATRRWDLGAMWEREEVYSCRIPGFVSHEIIPSRP